MKILAIDTSGKSTSAAILEDESLVQEMTVFRDVQHSEVLMPLVDYLCDAAGISVRDIDLFVSTAGPGSFTGLRIGLSTIKGLALATGKPAFGVSTLEALAFNVGVSPWTICPMLDARKNQVYAAVYRQERDGRMLCLKPDCLADLPAFVGGIAGDVIFVGDGAVRYRKEIESLIPGAGVAFAQPFQNDVRAAVVGFLGYRDFRAGRAMENAVSLRPAYLRLSEAEEKGRFTDAPDKPDKY